MPSRHYEVMVILHAGLEEDAIRKVIDGTTKLISDGGGTPGKVDRWGKRRFAYELNHMWEGYYVLVQCQAEPAILAEVDRTLRLNDGVIRHKVIRIPEHVAGQTRPQTAPEESADATNER